MYTTTVMKVIPWLDAKIQHRLFSSESNQHRRLP
jgi:hypothetical protein